MEFRHVTYGAYALAVVQAMHLQIIADIDALRLAMRRARRRRRRRRRRRQRLREAHRCR
jgi:hypothetical protein